ncbi:hypothetical protein BGX33_011657 [Mortierella sp. NVP41]|nr:hypothetical protein BGX33_011657 [Mortierella sp. NVP41]
MTDSTLEFKSEHPGQATVDTPVKDKLSITDNSQDVTNKPSRPARSTSTRSTKAIPRKEFKAIKKKLRKRELRRRNAVKNFELRTIQTTQMNPRPGGEATTVTMGLDPPDSLLQQCTAMTLAETEQQTLPTLFSSPPSSSLSSVATVFSIPELADSIAQYLNTSQRLKLCLVSKTFFQIFQPQLSISLVASAFHDPPFGAPGSNPILPEAFQIMAPRVDALTLDLHFDTGEAQQKAMLETIFQHSALALRRLRVTYWGEDLGVLEEIVTRLPNLEELSVLFKSSINATAFPKMLIEAGKSRTADGGLRSLAIELGIPRVMAMKMSVLSELVKVWPTLRSLELACISLQDSSQLSPTPPSIPPPPPPPPLQEAAAVLLHNIPSVPPSHGVSPSAPSAPLPNNSDDLLEHLSFARIGSLKLTGCPLTAESIRALDQLFPNLHELELSSCPGNWYREFAGVRTSQINPTPLPPPSADKDQPDVPFANLQSLKVWVKYQSARDKMLGIFKGRPHLACIETDILPDAREGLLELAAYCSGVNESELVGAVVPGSSVSTTTSPGTTTEAADLTKVRNRIKRLAIQTYCSPPQDIEVIERFYNAPAFRGLEYVYVQNRSLSMALFPFAKTLRELNLGGEQGLLRPCEVTTLNYILHRLPVLEVLKVDRYVDGDGLLTLFEGLGRDSGLNEKLSSLRKLRLFYQATNNNGGAGSNSPRALDLKELRRNVLNRFLLLEKLTVRGWMGADLPETKEIVRWQEGMVKDGQQSVTKCRAVFKRSTQDVVAVVV